MAAKNIIETLSLLSQSTDKTIEESISKASRASDWFKMISDAANKVVEDELSDELPTDGFPGLLEYAFEIKPVTKSKRKTSRFSKVTHVHNKRNVSSSRPSTSKTIEKIEEHQPASSFKMDEKKISLNSTYVKQPDSERKSQQNLNLTHRLLTPTQPVVEVLKRLNRKSSGVKVLRKSARSMLHAKLSGMQKSSPMNNLNKLTLKKKLLKSSVQKENSLIGKVFPKSSNVGPAKISSHQKLISEGNKVLRSKQPSHVQAPKSKNRTTSKITGNPKVEDKKSGILDSQKKNVKQSSKEPKPAIILKIKKNEIVTKQTSNKGKTPERSNKATTAVDSKQKFETKSVTPEATSKQLSTPAKATKSGISMTPAPLSLTDYTMTDFGSDSEDEPERKTQKPMPSWCIGLSFKKDLLSFHHSPMNTDELFGSVPENTDLEKIFNVKNKAYKVRSSSAIWNSPNAFW